MFGAIAGGIDSALAGGAMSKLFGSGQKAASGCIQGDVLATDNNTVGMGDAGIKSAIQGSNVPNPDEAVPSFVSGAMAKAGKGLLEGTLQAGTSAVSDKLLDLVGLGRKSAADKGKDTRDYLAAAFPELNAWERAGADRKRGSAGMPRPISYAVFCLKKKIRPRVQHARGRQEPVNEPTHPFPRQPVPLTASPQTLEPFHADVIAECREQISVRRYREVGEVAFDHGCEPPSLFVDRLMPVLSQRFLDLPKLGLHPLSLCLAPELEVGAVLLGAAVVCEPQEIERFRLSLAPVCSALGSVPAELDKAGFLRVQAERELGQAILEIVQETIRIMPVLEANDCIVGIPHDDHIARSVALAPLLDPEIVDIMEIHVRKQW